MNVIENKWKWQHCERFVDKDSGKWRFVIIYRNQGECVNYADGIEILAELQVCFGNTLLIAMI